MPEATVAAETRIVVDPVWGYRRLDPLPTASELDRFYESQYRDLLDSGGRAPELTRLMAGGPDAEREREWLSHALYVDVVDALEGGVAEHGLTRRALDVGCGTGNLMRDLVAAGWEAHGTEPATAFAAVGRAAGLAIEVATTAEYLETWRAAGAVPFAGVTLLNVLEHVPDPGGLVGSLVELLAPGGRVVARVPNDFNPLQAAAQRLLDRDPWWIAVPDHVNYFDVASFADLFRQVGLEVVDTMTDFPMELFLLMGEDYTRDPAVGRAVHERRRRADLALDPAARRSLGRAWAAAGVGRNTFVVARRPIT